MNWKNIIRKLMELPMTQAEIAAVCGCKQNTISDLYRGATAVPNFNLGQKLVDLHAQKVLRPPRSLTPAAHLAQV